MLFVFLFKYFNRFVQRKNRKVAKFQRSCEIYPVNTATAWELRYIIIGQDIVLFTGETIDWFSVISINLCIVIFVLPYLVYKMKYKNKDDPFE